MESIGYLLVYLVRGLLLWLTLNIHSNSDALQQKQDTSIAMLCSGSSPFSYCMHVSSRSQKPDYAFLLTLFHH